MQFRESQPIYLQIADFVCERILLKEWKTGERIPSVRELAVQLEVNPNTVLRTYDYLQQNEIIQNQRGVGYHVSSSAMKTAMKYRRNDFMERDLPALFRNLYLLDMEIEELAIMYEKYKRTNFNEKSTISRVK